MDELIRSLQEREDVSFEEAQYYIKKANGDIARAIYFIQKRRNSWFYRSSQWLKERLTFFWRYRIIISREEQVFINIPPFVLILFLLIFDRTWFAFGFFTSLLIVAVIILGVELKIVKPETSSQTTMTARAYSKERRQMTDNNESLSSPERQLPTGGQTSEQTNGQTSRWTSGKESFAQLEQTEYSEIIIK